MATLVPQHWHWRTPGWLQVGTMITTMIVFIGLYLFLVIGSAVGIYHYQARTPITRFTERIFPYPAAVVQGTVIPLERVRLQSEALVTYTLHHGQPANRANMQTVVLKQIIAHLLYRNDLQARGITVSQTAIDRQLATIAASAGGPEKLNQYLLTEYGPSMDINQFGDWVVRDSLAEAAVQYQLLTRVTLRHILIAVPANASSTVSDAAMAKVAAIRQQIKASDQFAPLANQYSEDVASKGKGGLIGTTGRGTDLSQFSPEFERAAFSLSPGSISEPLRTTYGWELLQVDQRQGSVDMSLTDYTAMLYASANVHRYLRDANMH